MTTKKVLLRSMLDQTIDRNHLCLRVIFESKAETQLNGATVRLCVLKQLKSRTLHFRPLC
eukprot:m.308912 g.308912  ORF g.308912 m.308912 type:complete len:60 (-) comp15942_c1_seq22:2097-2276(-)